MSSIACSVSASFLLFFENFLSSFGPASLCSMTDVIEGVKVIYLTSFYDAEKRVTGNLRMLSESDPAPINADMKSLIKTAEKETGIEYSEEQKNAIEHSLKNSVSVITGGPGTGKTTIINAIVRILDKSEFETSISAPTGRAAKRITETSGFEAKTIHRLLEYYYDESSSSMRFGRNQENPLDAKAVIVDEASMQYAISDRYSKYYLSRIF